jgi:hypothetical protein
MPNIRPPQRRQLPGLQLDSPKDMTDLIYKVQSQPSALNTGLQTGLTLLRDQYKKRKDLADAIAIGESLGLHPEDLDLLTDEDKPYLQQIKAQRLAQITPEGKAKTGLETRFRESEITKNLRDPVVPNVVVPGYQFPSGAPAVIPRTGAPIPKEVSGLVPIPPKPPIDFGAQTEAREEAKARVKSKTELATIRPVVESAMKEISRVQELNKDTYGGAAGGLAMKAKSALNIGDDAKFRNTSDVINTMQAQVAGMLKATFGGQLSDSERLYLNQVYGALPNMSQTERDVAMTNVKTMIGNKLSSAESKYGELSGGLKPLPTGNGNGKPKAIVKVGETLDVGNGVKGKVLGFE